MTPASDGNPDDELRTQLLWCQSVHYLLKGGSLWGSGGGYEEGQT